MNYNVMYDARCTGNDVLYHRNYLHKLLERNALLSYYYLDKFTNKLLTTQRFFIHIRILV